MKRLFYLICLAVFMLSADVPADEPQAEESLKDCLVHSFASSEEEYQLLEESFKKVPVLEICIDETKGSIEEMNADPKHETKCSGIIRLLIPDGYEEEYTGKVYEKLTVEEYELDYIRGRGNSTWAAGKKPYRIKLDKKADLFGMGGEKNWVLLANYYDMTMLRNKLTYSIGSQFMPEGSFTPQSVFVNVVMNGRYLGLYCLTEQVRIGSVRVDIDDLEKKDDLPGEDDLTGGYLLSMELFNAEVRVFHTPRNVFCIESPGYGYLTEEEFEYITSYMDDLEEVICFSPEGPDGSFRDLLDIDSFLDYYLIQEFSRNGDAYSSDSTYLYKERNGKLYFGPLWDFDYVAWGGDNAKVEGFRNVDAAPWLVYLLKDETVRQKLSERWEVLKELLTEAISDGGMIDRYVDEIYTSQQANYFVASTYLWDVTVDEQDDSGLTYGREVTFDAETARLKSWIADRLAWMDEHLPEIRAGNVHLEFRDGNAVIEYKLLGRDEALTEDLLPSVPRRDGYRFTGWYRTDQEGNEILLSSSDPQMESADIIVYQAGWEEFDPDTVLEHLSFSSDTFTVNGSSYIDLTDWVETVPDDFGKEFLQFTAVCEPEDCAYLSDNYLAVSKEGKVKITVSCGSRSAECEIVILEE